jgi:hypothetical protein
MIYVVQPLMVVIISMAVKEWGRQAVSACSRSIKGTELYPRSLPVLQDIFAAPNEGATIITARLSMRVGCEYT